MNIVDFKRLREESDVYHGGSGEMIRHLGNLRGVEAKGVLRKAVVPKDGEGGMYEKVVEFREWIELD